MAIPTLSWILWKLFGIRPKSWFSPSEIKRIKDASIQFPLMVYEGTNPNNVIQIYQVVSISGMADNKGIPSAINVVLHQKARGKTRLTYKLK
jgi:hypothetical protein